jgi:hypothetical protein
MTAASGGTEMFGTIRLVKRTPGLTHQQFRDRCETSHRRSSQKAIERIAACERFYLHPITDGGAEPIYDAVIRTSFPDRAAYELCGADSLAEDARNFLDPEACALFEARDSSSKLQPLPPSDNPFRTIWFARHRRGMSHEQCRTYYENKHRLLGEYIMNGYAYNYDRHFLYRIAPEALEPYYTFIMNMNFPARSRFDQLSASIANDPTLTRFVAEDEARFIDRDSAVHYAAELCTSPPT